MDGGTRVLFLDGSNGLRVVSEIIQFDHFLRTKLDVQNEYEASPQPHEHFCLIGNTSVGGLLAITFGLLEMSCDEARNTYIPLGQLVHAEEVTTKKVTSQPDRTRFTAVLEALIKDKFGSAETKMQQLSHSEVKAKFSSHVRASTTTS